MKIIIEERLDLLEAAGEIVKKILVVVFLSVMIPGLMPASCDAQNQITMTIVYDDYVHTPGTISNYGFACFISGTEQTILFDTGYRGEILMMNLDTLAVDLDSLDAIVLSHNHIDHTGGIDSVLARKSAVAVYFGNSFPDSIDQYLSNKGAFPVRVTEPMEVCRNVYSTGDLLNSFPEQFLILDTDSGMVLITGCAHPGIINILHRAKEILNRDIYLVFGGFHLRDLPVDSILQIIQEFRLAGVKKCGPTHCTGDTAIALFQAAYGADFIPMGVGKVVEVTANTVTRREENDRQSQIPSQFKLKQNYPNPFNPGTTIAIDIPATSQVTLKIFNILGEEVTTLVSGQLIQGTYSYEWDGSNVAAGVYLCRLLVGSLTRSSESYVETRKMVLMP